MNSKIGKVATISQYYYKKFAIYTAIKTKGATKMKDKIIGTICAISAIIGYGTVGSLYLERIDFWTGAIIIILTTIILFAGFCYFNTEKRSDK